MTSPRPLILDCDGVLLNWLAGFSAYASHRLGKPLIADDNPSFDLSIWLGVDDKTVGDMIQAYNCGEGGFFGNLKPLPGAREALAAAHGAGRKISVVTSCSTLPEVVAARETNLHRVFGNIFDDIICLDPAVDKSPTLAAMPKGAWVEDKYENAVTGADLGHDSYVIRYSYNVKKEPLCRHPRLTWVDGWACIKAHEHLAP